MYKYLVTSTAMAPFLTNWFDVENNFNKEVEMVVFDLENNQYYDGNGWTEIQEDHL